MNGGTAMATILNAEDIVTAIISQSKVVNRLPVQLSRCTSSAHADVVKWVETIVFKEAAAADDKKIENF